MPKQNYIEITDYSKRVHVTINFSADLENPFTVSDNCPPVVSQFLADLKTRLITEGGTLPFERVETTYPTNEIKPDGSVVLQRSTVVTDRVSPLNPNQFSFAVEQIMRRKGALSIIDGGIPVFAALKGREVADQS